MARTKTRVQQAHADQRARLAALPTPTVAVVAGRVGVHPFEVGKFLFGRWEPGMGGTFLTDNEVDKIGRFFASR